MSTDPFPALLNPDFAKAEIRDILVIVDPLLNEFINYGTWLLRRCYDEAVRRNQIYFPVLSLYHHILESVDGVRILVGQAALSASIPLMRSTFEASVAIEYLLEDEKSYTERSVAWMTEYYREKMRIIERLNPSTPKGTAYNQAKQRDLWINDVEMPDQSIVQGNLDYFQKKISESPYKEMNDLFESAKTKKGYPRWYELLGGGQNFRSLMERVGRDGQYDPFYGLWSGKIHASDVSMFSFSMTDEENLRPLRGGNSIIIAMHVVSMISWSTTLILRHFRKGEREVFGEWYIKNIHPLTVQLRNITE